MSIDSKKQLRVLYLITKSNWGGAQRYVYDLAVASHRAGMFSSVALGGNGELATRLLQANVPVHTLPSLERNIGLFKEWRAWKEIVALLKKTKPDVLHINSSKAGIMGALAGRLYGVPRIIFTAHGWAFNEKRPWWQRLILKKIHWFTVLLAHTTISVSEVTKRQMNWPGAARKMTVIYNGLAPQTLLTANDARTQLAIDHHELAPYLHDTWSVSIGELHPTKQHDVMIRAMQKIVETQPHARHIIMGAGESRTALEKLITKHVMQQHVFLLGNVPEAARYLTAFSFMVLPSRTEALPYVLLEACGAGLPVIASEVGGIPEIIRHNKEGLLTPSGNVDTLTRACLKLLKDEPFRAALAHNARTRVAQFRTEDMLEQTFALYH